MEFIDRTGHIFSIQTYNDDLGWEFKDQDYIFWFNDPYTQGKLSVGSYYIQQITPYIDNINIIGQNESQVDISDIISIKILCKSNIFKLIPYNIINESINNIDNNTGAIDVDTIYHKGDYNKNNNISEIVYNKEQQQFIIDTNSNDMILPFFIICNYNEEGTVMTNILIEVIYNEHYKKQVTDNTGNIIETDELVQKSSFTVIRTGGLFVDESEQLVINSTNMGRDIPKSILDGVYQHGLTLSGDIDYDIALYNEKLKEYLLNYSDIRGQIGNYNSALNSLHWFGWGDKLKLTKLLQTDNKLLNQYVRDSFESDEDTISAFMNFRNTTFVSLSLKDNDIIYKENINNTNNINHLIYNKQDWNTDSDFIGEGLPTLQDLFDRWDKIHFDECEDIDYYQPYYIYNKNIILLKLAFFKYYYKKYFLPVHLSPMTVSSEHRCFMSDLKLYTVCYEQTIQKPLLCSEPEPIVTVCNKPCITSQFDINNSNINKIHNIYINTKQHYIDSDFCEFENYNNDNIIQSNNIYESHELSFEIPVSFNINNADIDTNNYIYKTNIIIYKNNRLIYNKYKEFIQSDNMYGKFKSIVIIPHLNDQLKKYDIDWQTYDKDSVYRMEICCNGKWFTSLVSVSLPKPELHTYYLQYKYNNKFSQISNIITESGKPEKVEFNGFMYQPELITVNDTNYRDNLLYFNSINKLDNFVSLYREQYNLPLYINAPWYYNIILYYDIEISDNTVINNIYSTLFEYNGEKQKYILKVNISDNIDFDGYLMFDSKEQKYYMVFISTETISNIPDYNINSNIKDYIKETIDINSITIKYSSYKYEFLINRMQLIEPENNNHFSKYNILCCSLYNLNNPLNKSIGFNMKCHSKWTLIPYSIYNSHQKAVSSNSAIGIISLQTTESDYLSGIYSIKCDWSFNGTTTNSINCPYRLRID